MPGFCGPHFLPSPKYYWPCSSNPDERLGLASGPRYAFHECMQEVELRGSYDAGRIAKAEKDSMLPMDIPPDIIGQSFVLFALAPTWIRERHFRGRR